jgi:mycothiol synthase
MTPADFAAVARLKNDVNAGAGLLVVSTAEEVAEELSGPYVTLETDTVCMERDGIIVGYAHTVFLDSEEKELRCYVFGGVHPAMRGRGIGSAMLSWGTARAGAQLQANPLGLPTAVRAASLDGDTASADLLQAHGFVPERWFNDLHRTLDDLPPVRQPDGLTLQPWDMSRNEELRGVKNVAFRDHWGSTPTSAEGWEQLTSGFGARTDLSFMALDTEGNVVGLVLTHRYPDDDAVIGGRYGWIDKVATLAEWRGRGVAGALIATALAAYAREGLTHAALDVDTDNPTGAFGLYTAMGFAPLRGSVDYRLGHTPACGA